MSDSKKPRELSLDPSLYVLKDDEKDFLKQLTRIEDDEDLKEHILAVQREAFAVYPYPCIQGFRFLNLKIAKMPVYKDVLALGNDRKDAILLDIGCCFGNDSRKVALDGFPSDQIIASDLKKEFWDLGHKLFKSDPADFPITFVPGDIFDDNFLKLGAPASPLKQGESNPSPRIGDLNLTDSLNPLLGKISVIHASSFMHLFNETNQTIVARKLAGLLSSESGSIIFGSHLGSPAKGQKKFDLYGTTFETFCHTPESFKKLWEETVFGEGQVVCEAKNYQFRGDNWALIWSVRRV